MTPQGLEEIATRLEDADRLLLDALRRLEQIADLYEAVAVVELPNEAIAEQIIGWWWA